MTSCFTLPQDYYLTKPHPELDVCYAELQASVHGERSQWSPLF